MHHNAVLVDKVNCRIRNAGFEGNFLRVKDSVPVNDFMIYVLEEREVEFARIIDDFVSHIPRFIVAVQADGQELDVFLFCFA